MERKKYESCLRVLKEELVPAMGCTEPVSVAYAAALARDALGALPDRVEICVSGNILKNVKSVVVPNTGGLRGIAAVEAGLVGMEMYRRGSEFVGGDGIVEKGVENTIRAVGDLARNGMRATDEEIIRLMIKNI